MMFTRRSLLFGSAAAWSAGPVRAGTAPAPAPGTTQPLLLEARPRALDAGTLEPPLGFGGDEPFRVVRIRKGEAFAVRLRNGLKEPISLEWHGVRGANALDDPTFAKAATIPEAGEQTLRFTPRDSGTAWFHPSASTTHLTARGLAGVLVVEEPEAPSVDHDVVCFLAEGLPPSGSAGDGPPGPLLVNARAAPLAMRVRPGSRLRLRFVNGSLNRPMLLECVGSRPFIIAIDGQPSDLFEPIRRTFPMGPGTRFDILLDMPATAGQTARVLLKQAARGTNATTDSTVADFTTEGSAQAARPPIAPLAANPALPKAIPLERAKRTELVFASDATGGSTTSWSVNGVKGAALPEKPVTTLQKNDAVVLSLVNAAKVAVPLRVHGHTMRLLHAKDDGWEPYWRDTIIVPPGNRAHVAFMADIPGRWLIESAVEDQALAGLRCWFAVRG